MITATEFNERLADVARLTQAGARFETEESEIRGIVRRNYVRRPLSLAAMFDKTVAENPNAVALTEAQRAITFQELADEAGSLAAALQRTGLVKGDRVGILGANSIEWVTAFWACVLAGFVSVPLNGLWTRDELLYAIEHSGMVCCFVDEKRYAVARGVLDDGAFVPLGSFEPLERPATDGTINHVEHTEDDYLSLFYTSGTTGQPKGAMIDHRGIVANLQNLVYFTIRSRILSGTPRRSPDAPRTQNVSLLALPLFHVTGCHATMVVSLVFGNQVVLYPPRAFDSEVAMELIQRHSITTFVGVPTLMSRMLDAPTFTDYDLSSLRTVGFGGAPVSPDLAKRTRAALGRLESFSNGYGLTETNAAVIGNYGVEYEMRPDSVGKPAPNVEVAIVDGEGNEVDPGERGEILIGGPMLMVGYWQNPEATNEAIRDGWFHTGDVGVIDEDGYISVVDRIKDVVIRGGENVYSAEVEHVIESHPAVVEAAVIGVPHPDLGEEVKAVVVTSSHVDGADLDKHCRERIAGYKVPTQWELRAENLPRNAAGKVRKGELRGVSR